MLLSLRLTGGQTAHGIGHVLAVLFTMFLLYVHSGQPRVGTIRFGAHRMERNVSMSSFDTIAATVRITSPVLTNVRWTRGHHVAHSRSLRQLPPRMLSCLAMPLSHLTATVPHRASQQQDRAVLLAPNIDLMHLMDALRECPKAAQHRTSVALCALYNRASAKRLSDAVAMHLYRATHAKAPMVRPSVRRLPTPTGVTSQVCWVPTATMPQSDADIETSQTMAAMAAVVSALWRAGLVYCVLTIQQGIVQRLGRVWASAALEVQNRLRKCAFAHPDVQAQFEASRNMLDALATRVRMQERMLNAYTATHSRTQLESFGQIDTIKSLQTLVSILSVRLFVEAQGRWHAVARNQQFRHFAYSGMSQLRHHFCALQQDLATVQAWHADAEMRAAAFASVGHEFAAELEAEVTAHARAKAWVEYYQGWYSTLSQQLDWERFERAQEQVRHQQEVAQVRNAALDALASVQRELVAKKTHLAQWHQWGNQVMADLQDNPLYCSMCVSINCPHRPRIEQAYLGRAKPTWVNHAPGSSVMEATQGNRKRSTPWDKADSGLTLGGEEPLRHVGGADRHDHGFGSSFGQ